MQQHSETVYGVRGTTSSRGDGFVPRGGYPTRDEKPERGRPESMYGTVGGSSRRGQSAQSDDSSYGSCQGPSGRNNGGANNGYHVNGSYAQKTGR